ncbi:MAG: DinB family protein [Desulfovibrio sp.]|jgi:uncharacterized damage-inducible protein DinB|nr:DinB family protein [Desulfovibrio sp.]
MQDYFATLALANRWANALLYAELAKLSPAQLAQASEANFGSMLAIANHTVLADRAWLCRFTGEGGPVASVDAVPWPDFADLRAAREAGDARMVAFTEGLAPERLAGTLRYRDMKGRDCAEPFLLCLGHFYNHQTFHRGQLHALLGLCGIKAPNLDLIYYHVAQRRASA